MKNTLNVRREFGKVVIQACLPSLEDFVQKISDNRVENVVGHLDTSSRRRFYCDALTECYYIDVHSTFREFLGDIEKQGHLNLEYHFGSIHLCSGDNLNLVPFVSRGIGTPKTLEFQGIYNEKILKRVVNTIQGLVEYARNYRQPVVFNFEIHTDDEEEKPITIQI